MTGEQNVADLERLVQSLIDAATKLNDLPVTRSATASLPKLKSFLLVLASLTEKERAEPGSIASNSERLEELSRLAGLDSKEVSRFITTCVLDPTTRSTLF